MLGEDRRAPANTIDESVWETLARDIQAVWGKMRQVLWPRHVLVGILHREEFAGDTARLQGNVMTHRLRSIMGKWSDANPVLEGEMSKGLRDWDLWWDYPHAPEISSLILCTGVLSSSVCC